MEEGEGQRRGQGWGSLGAHILFGWGLALGGNQSSTEWVCIDPGNWLAGGGGPARALSETAVVVIWWVDSWLLFILVMITWGSAPLIGGLAREALPLLTTHSPLELLVSTCLGGLVGVPKRWVALSAIVVCPALFSLLGLPTPMAMPWVPATGFSVGGL